MEDIYDQFELEVASLDQKYARHPRRQKSDLTNIEARKPGRPTKKNARGKRH